MAQRSDKIYIFCYICLCDASINFICVKENLICVLFSWFIALISLTQSLHYLNKVITNCFFRELKSIRGVSLIVLSVETVTFCINKVLRSK